MHSDEYEFIRKYFKSLSGIELGDDRQFLVESRLIPMLAQMGFKSLGELVTALRNRPSQELQNYLINGLTTNESLFFRDKTPFETLASILLPKLIPARPSKKLRIWSAACSTGQEPYSIAMTLSARFPELQRWDVSILATDISPRVIEHAKKGVFSDFEIQRGLDESLRDRFFAKQGNAWAIDERIKKMVQFESFNLLKTPYALGPFDAVFCRNVIIYFDSETKRQVLNGIFKTLVPDGYLVLGGSESIIGYTELFQKLDGTNFVFVPKPEARLK